VTKVGIGALAIFTWLLLIVAFVVDLSNPANTKWCILVLLGWAVGACLLTIGVFQQPTTRDRKDE
jgi:hypothetical protein